MGASADSDLYERLLSCAMDGVVRWDPYHPNLSRSTCKLVCSAVRTTVRQTSLSHSNVVFHVDQVREHPNVVSERLEPGQAASHSTAKTVHPAFHGCYDWHSAVHSHWLIARVLRSVGGSLRADLRARAISILDEHLNAGTCSAQQVCLSRQSSYNSDSTTVLLQSFDNGTFGLRRNNENGERVDRGE